MSVTTIMLFTILVIFIVRGACDPNSDKSRTSSRMFTKMKSNEANRCQFIIRDFSKLKGTWNYVLRTVTSKNTPEIRCGHLVVNEILEDGFESNLKYMTNRRAIVQTQMTGLSINETTIGIPQLENIITDHPQFQQPFYVEIGICDNDTILFIEPLYYYGGGMVFTRNIPDSIAALKLRFGTYDE